jgi:hypothetical protein
MRRDGLPIEYSISDVHASYVVFLVLFPVLTMEKVSSECRKVEGGGFYYRRLV